MKSDCFKYRCQAHGNVVEYYGETLKVFCDGKFHILKNTNTDYEFIQKDHNGRIVFCPEYEVRMALRNKEEG